MKLRSAFVSNSSSSSYVCDICGCIEAGRDASARDFDMICTDNFTYCVDHIKDERIGNYIRTNINKLDDDFMEFASSTDDFITFVNNNTDELIGKTFRDEFISLCYEKGNVPKTVCPCECLDNISDDILLKYMLRQQYSTKQTIINIIREQFQTMSNLNKYLQ